MVPIGASQSLYIRSAGRSLGVGAGGGESRWIGDHDKCDQQVLACCHARFTPLVTATWRRQSQPPRGTAEDRGERTGGAGQETSAGSRKAALFPQRQDRGDCSCADAQLRFLLAVVCKDTVCIQR